MGSERLKQMNFTQKLQYFMGLKRWSDEKWAEKTDLSVSTIQHIRSMASNRLPRWDMSLAILFAGRLPYDALEEAEAQHERERQWIPVSSIDRASVRRTRVKMIDSDVHQAVPKKALEEI